MDWLLVMPQMHSAFSSLGSLEGDSYVVSPNALAILEEINYKLTSEDQTLRTFRRAIGFGQNVRSDLIPLLENAKDEAVLDSVIRILVNLTIPVECLFSIEVMYRTEVGRHTIFEINKLLYTSKVAFADPKSTKSVVEYMKYILESDAKLSPQKCNQINNCLLLLRNILHIPETYANLIMHTMQAFGGNATSMQNSIIWNLFIQSIDKLLLNLMTCPHRAFWGVTMVQLISLIYKDQHVGTLQKLLSLWFEASLSESSEDNESNTSPPKQGSGGSTPMLTSDPTSDNSDDGSCGSKNEDLNDRRKCLRKQTEATLQEVSRKSHKYQNDIQNESRVNANKSNNFKVVNNKQTFTSTSDEEENRMVLDKSELVNLEEVENEPMEIRAGDAGKFKPPQPLLLKPSISLQTNLKVTECIESTFEEEIPKISPIKLDQKSPHNGQFQLTKGKCSPQKRECPSSQSELSDCGYGTQVENQESISTSSNDDDGTQGKRQHQKPLCNTKPRKGHRTVSSALDTKEQRRKKLVKRSKSSLINMKGLVQHIPTNEDISNLLKEFTIDFLLKGYGHLVEELYLQLFTNAIDTSYFFWLITFFLKCAAQLELDMEHIDTILTYDVISYLAYEGVSLCEQFEINARQEGSDLKPYLRRMHLVVTAIREFLQAIETYNKITHLSDNDRGRIRQLQLQISATEDIRCLFVLLLRRFNPSIHTKQYLQDLVVANHKLLLMLDSTEKLIEQDTFSISEHVSQFATVEIMHYYGILLEDFNTNDEFVNDCIFTMMHHVGGDLGHVCVLFQPIILKTYSRIRETDYELCDDWFDLIEYVLHKFINTPQKSPPSTSITEMTKEYNLENTVCTWPQEEMDLLNWFYVQSKKSTDIVGKIVKLFNSNGNHHKSRFSIIKQLLQQDIITLVEYDDLMKVDDAEYQRTLLTTPTSETTESGIDIKESASGKSSDDIQILIDLIVKQNKGHHLVWLQKQLLECCYVKLSLEQQDSSEGPASIMEPVTYYCICRQISIPIVQWNNDQATTMFYQPFMLLLHKLGFHLPSDAGSIFARIPNNWTVETMFGLAKKLGPLNKLSNKFDWSKLELDNSTNPLNRCQQRSYQHQHSNNISGYCHNHRNLLSSSASLDIDLAKADGPLAIVPEVDPKVEKAHADRTEVIFAVPKPKPANAKVRNTYEALLTPAVPNWLQLVMRSKCYQSSTPSSKNDIPGIESHDAEEILSSKECNTYVTYSTLQQSLTSARTTTLRSLPMMNHDTGVKKEIQQHQNQQLSTNNLGATIQINKNIESSLPSSSSTAIKNEVIEECNELSLKP